MSWSLVPRGLININKQSPTLIAASNGHYFVFFPPVCARLMGAKPDSNFFYDVLVNTNGYYLAIKPYIGTYGASRRSSTAYKDGFKIRLSSFIIEQYDDKLDLTPCKLKFETPEKNLTGCYYTVVLPNRG
jgi:hypothetical protein